MRPGQAHPCVIVPAYVPRRFFPHVLSAARRLARAGDHRQCAGRAAARPQRRNDHQHRRHVLHRRRDRARPRAHRRALRRARPELQADRVRLCAAADADRYPRRSRGTQFQSADLARSSRHGRCRADQARRAAAVRIVPANLSRSDRKPEAGDRLRDHRLRRRRARRRQDQRHAAVGAAREHRPARQFADPPGRSRNRRRARRAWRLHRRFRRAGLSKAPR